MILLIEDPLAPIKYASEIRSYALTIPACYRKKNEICVSFMITHCPRCGTKLPRDLADEWSEIVRRDYHVTDELDDEQFKQLPQEFKTDEWWKNRGL
jgi:hypothetical protein